MLADGELFTVRDLVAVAVPQVLLTVYFTVTVPAVEPVTTPPDVMVAEPVPLVIDQVPPVVASLNVVETPTHIEAAPPVIDVTVGEPFMVSDFVAVTVP